MYKLNCINSFLVRLEYLINERVKCFNCSMNVNMGFILIKHNQFGFVFITCTLLIRL